MAELVGLITGIGSIVATAFKLSKMIVAIADELGTAGAQIRAIATDTKAMALVLHNLRARLKRDLRKINTEAKEILKESIDLCANEIQSMDRHLMPLCGSGEGQRMDFKQKTMWLFAKTKISTTKASLDSIKLTLSLLLSTLEYMEGGDVEEIIEENIRQMISTTKTTKDTFLKAQRVDMAREIIYERSINRQQTPEETRSNLSSPSSTLVEPAQVNLHLEYEANDKPTSTSMYGDGNDDGHIAAMAQDPERNDMGENIDGARMLAAAMNVPELHDAINQASQLAVMAHHAEDRHQTRQDSHDFEQVNRITDWSLMRLLSDDSFLQIADHIRLQKTVSGFALDTMAEIQKSEDTYTTPEIDEPAPSGPDSSHRGSMIESGEGHDPDQGPQLRTHINEEGPSRISGSLPSDDDSSINTSEAPARKRSSSGTGSLPRWPGYPTRRVLYDVQDRVNDGGSSPSQPGKPQHPWGNKPSSPDFYMMPDHGAHERQNYQTPFPADINFGPHAPPPQGSGAGRFPYKSFGQSTGPTPQAPWDYPAGVANGPNYTPPRYNWDYRVPSPPSSTNGGRSSPKLEQPVPELVKVKARLEALRLEREKADQARERAETERKIREDAEREFKTRMEAVRETQVEAHKEIELAKTAAEQAAREKIEEERKAEDMRREELDNVRVRAELEFPKKMEQAAMEKKQRQGLMKYFKRS